eukprot:TRINITY_DN1815_c0_g1_i1.p1 TRINITY_DN1815_c0_g1~~TRINITY_DN1815_c0_g1_i1.p1  ORF type:complete len:361 (+),score=86.89 TRINITY_DN1815_c0_g1_i1:84-1166(+)
MPQLDNLYVKGLPSSATEEDVLDIFSPFGQVVSCRVISNQGADCATAFVRYASAECAAYALKECNGTAPRKFYVQMSEGMGIRFADTPEEKQARIGAVRFEPYPAASVTAVSPPTQYGGKDQGKGGAGNLGQIVDDEQQRHILGHFKHPVLGVMALVANMQGEPGTNLFIGDLPAPLSEYAVYALFSPFGAIASIKVGRDAQNPQRHNGYAFVRYAHADSAAAAIEAMNGAVLVPGFSPLVVQFKTQAGAVRGAAAQDGNAAAAGAPAAAAPAEGGFTEQCTVQLAVPKSHRGQLVGAEAQVLKDLQARYGVVLTVPREQEPEGTPTVVTGPTAQVYTCVAEIGQRLHRTIQILSDSRQG